MATSSRSWRRCEMASYDVRIITASYRREPRNAPEPAQLPVIQIFGRTREGQSITIEYSGFQPYFFVVEPPQSLRGAFGRDSQVVKLEDVTLQVEGRPTPCARVVLRQPWKTPSTARRPGGTDPRRWKPTSPSSIGSFTTWISVPRSASTGRRRTRPGSTRPIYS